MAGPVLWVFSFVLGAIVGSFLNACIHRMPRGISLSTPRRSFCPSCNRQIPFWENLPMVSWLLLRGKCSGCGAKISFRYFIVELLTACLFLACAWQFGGGVVVVYWVFVALLIAATFIDFEHLIIPDEITIGGTVAGLIFSAIFPTIMGETVFWRGLLFSLAGAFAGFALLWVVVELGKLAFGKKRFKFDEEENFSIHISEDTATLTIGEEKIPWEEIFSRETDELVLECTEYKVDKKFSTDTCVSPDQARMFLRIRHDGFFSGDQKIPLSEVAALHGSATSMTIPREAMGFGDVKFMATIGAFLGLKAVFFTVFAAAVVGAFVGAAMLLATRGKQGGRIPFGPYLAMGALLWMFIGPAIVDWYMGLLSVRPY